MVVVAVPQGIFLSSALWRHCGRVRGFGGGGASVGAITISGRAMCG